MKRIVLPLLLSSAYVALMTALFSSPFGQENSFLFEDPSYTAFTNRGDIPDLSLLPAHSDEPAIELETEHPEAKPASEEHSPESAAN